MNCIPESHLALLIFLALVCGLAIGWAVGCATCCPGDEDD